MWWDLKGLTLKAICTKGKDKYWMSSLMWIIDKQIKEIKYPDGKKSIYLDFRTEVNRRRGKGETKAKNVDCVGGILLSWWMVQCARTYFEDV